VVLVPGLTARKPEERVFAIVSYRRCPWLWPQTGKRSARQHPTTNMLIDHGSPPSSAPTVIAIRHPKNEIETTAIDRNREHGQNTPCRTACTTIGAMAGRQKRSISLPHDLADAIDQAAASEGTTVSAWIADTAAHRLRLEAGGRGIAQWERQHGALTADELADGLARARSLLRRRTRKSA